MTTGGWSFMLGSLALVWGLAAWCLYRLLHRPPEVNADATRAPESD